MSNDTDGGNSE